ncbi:stage III sporulation protein AA [Lucifera butyrica]|nr:stage III sporulation protein AA [Lucifera butyrica]
MNPVLKSSIYPVLPANLTAIFESVPSEILHRTTEIRLRISQPLLLRSQSGDVMLGNCGQPVQERQQAYLCKPDDIHKSLLLMCQNSIYAFEEELRAGFLTLQGGHRVGVAGQVVFYEGRVKTFKCVSSLNIRLAREVTGCADLIFPYILAGKKILNSLIISPPRCGKTTILRDLARHISTGDARYNFPGAQVGIVDERSEIAACVQGVPSVDLGERVDVLDGCLKAHGMLMLIRSMAPQVIITDELGREEDTEAICEAIHAGTSVITTVHGQSIEDILNRPYVGELIKRLYFHRYIILNDTPQPGTVKEITDAQTGKMLYLLRKGVKICG